MHGRREGRGRKNEVKFTTQWVSIEPGEWGQLPMEFSPFFVYLTSVRLWLLEQRCGTYSINSASFSVGSDNKLSFSDLKSGIKHLWRIGSICDLSNWSSVHAATPSRHSGQTTYGKKYLPSNLISSTEFTPTHWIKNIYINKLKLQ